MISLQKFEGNFNTFPLFVQFLKCPVFIVLYTQIYKKYAFKIIYHKSLMRGNQNYLEKEILKKWKVMFVDRFRPNGLWHAEWPQDKLENTINISRY